MNRFLLIAISLFATTSAFAQVDGNYNYSIGLKGYSLMQMPKILQQTNTSDYNDLWLNGGIIRFNDNQMAFRVSGHYLFKRDLKFNNQCDNCESAQGNLTDYAIKLGFEKNFNYAVLQPYFAADFGFRSNSFKGSLTSQNPASLKMPYTSTATKNGATFSPIFGLKVNVLKQVSIYAESGIEFFYSYERQESVLNDASNTRTFAKYTKLEGLLNPVSVGIQFHLVGRD